MKFTNLATFCLVFIYFFTIHDQRIQFHNRHNRAVSQPLKWISNMQHWMFALHGHATVAYNIKNCSHKLHTTCTYGFVIAGSFNVILAESSEYAHSICCPKPLLPVVGKPLIIRFDGNIVSYCIAGYNCKSKFLRHWKNSLQQKFLRLLSLQDNKIVGMLYSLEISLPVEFFVRWVLICKFCKKFGPHRKNPVYSKVFRCLTGVTAHDAGISNLEWST